METQLSNPTFIVIKAILACSVALLLDYLLGNPDHVSSTFVAVLCVSPTVLIGLRNAWAQIMGSILGGIWGTAANLIGLLPWVGLPLAVGGAIATTFAFRVPGGYPVASFTALFMILVPFEDPLNTFGTRFLALFIAALSSFLVNTIVSAMLYKSIFERRLTRVENFVFDSLEAVLAGDMQRADASFALLNVLEQQLRQTLFELHLRRSWELHKELNQKLVYTQRLHYFLHLIWDLSHLYREEQISDQTIAPFLTWIQTPEQQDFVLLPDALLGLQKRIVSVLGQLRAVR